MNPSRMLGAAAVLGGLAVAAGAFGAHGLADRLAAEDLATFETAVRYQMYHALALALCAVLARQGARVAVAAQCFLWGTVVFSGSLYLLVLTGPRWLGAITPIGGLLMIAGWAALVLRAPFSARSTEVA